MTIESLDDLLLEELKDLYDAEKQLVRALPKMAKAASDDDLKTGFQEHLEQTKEHVVRLERVFEMMETKPKGKPCEAMKGLIQEGQETIQEDAEPGLLDVMLITAAQKVEHYEISAYGTLRAIAEAMGNEDVAELLTETLDEEKETDEKLTEISERILAELAGAGGEDEEDSDDEDGEFEDEDDEDDTDEEEETPAPRKPAVKKAAPKKRA